MAAPAAILQVVIEADARSAVRTLDKFDTALRSLDKKTPEIDLKTDTRKATAALSRYDDALDRTDKRTVTATTRTTQLGKATSNVGSRLRSAAGYAAGAAAAYLSISQAKAAVETTQQLAGATATLNRNLGIDIKNASRWASVAQTRDIATKELNASFTTLAQNLADVNAGVDDAMEPFRALGITQKELDATGGNFNKTLMLVSDSLEDAKGGADRQAAASRLLGRGYQNLVPIMGQGSDALREQLKLGDQYGATMGKDAVKAQTDLTAKLRESERAWQGLKVTFTEAITPAISKANDVFQRLSRIMANDKLTNTEKFEKVGRIIEKWADKAFDVFIKILPKIVAEVGERAPRIAKALIEGFLQAPIWGKVLLGGFFLSKLGGLGFLGKLGGKMAGKLASGIAGALGSTAIGKMLANSLAIVGWGPVGAAAAALFAVGFAAYLGAKSGLGEKIADLTQRSIEDADIAAAAQSVLGDSQRTFRDWIRDAKEAGNQVTVQMVKAWEKSGLVSHTEADRMIHAIKRVRDDWKSGWGPVNNATKDAGKQAGDNLENGAKRGGKAGQNLRNNWERDTKAVRDAAGKNAGGAARDVDQKLGDAANKGDKHGRNLKEGFGGSVTALAHTTRGAMQNIGDNVNEAAGKLGVQKKIKFSFKDMAETSGGGAGAARQRGGPIALALGGLAAMVPGRSSGDRHTLSIDGVPKAKVESGEGVFVGNRKMMGAAAAANAAVPRFATGGVAQPPGDPGSEVVQAAYASDVGQFLKRFGMDLTQGYNPSGPSVSPGHLSLDAAPSLDVVPLSGDWDGLFAQGLKWALSQGMQVGYDGQYGTQSWPDHGEGNHAHIDWKSGGKLGAMVEQIAKVVLEGPDGPLKDLGQKAIDMTRSAANKFLAKQAPGADTMGVGSYEGPLDRIFPATTLANPGALLSSAQVQSVMKPAGLPAVFDEIAFDESGRHPGIVGYDRGGTRGLGLWQITTGFNDDIIRRFGGEANMRNPVINALAAKAIYDRQPSAWSASGHMRGGLLALAEGGEVSIPELFPHLGSDDQDRRKNTLDRILGKIADFGIKDWWADPLYAGTKNVADYQDFASLAASSDVTDANDNLIPGIFSREGIDGTQHAWLLKARDEAWNLRKNLITAKDAMPGQIDQFEGHAGLINKTEKRLGQVRDALHDAQEKLRDLLDEIERQRDKIERQREIIEDARGQLDRQGLSNAQKNHQQDRIDEAQAKIDTARGVIENITGERIPGVENDIQRATRERDTLIDPITTALGDKYADLIAIREGITNEGWTDDVTGKSFDSLKTIQGAGSSMDPNMEMPDNLHQIFGGTLNDIQQELLAMIPEAKPGDTVIDQLEAALALSGLTADLSDDIAAQSQIVTYWEEELARLQETGGSAQDIASAANSLSSARDALAGLQETTAPDTGTADALRMEALQAENARLRMSAQQAGTFAGFFKQFSAMPQFATGGVMDRTGPALVHGREGIFTPDQMAALGGRGDVVVNVNLDGMDVVVETFIGGVLAKETRKALGRGPTAGRKTAGRRS